MYKVLLKEYSVCPRDVCTVPLDGSLPKWFYVFVEDDRLCVSAGRNHSPVCDIKGVIALEEKQVEAMFNIYCRRSQGEAVSAEAHRISFQASYWYGVFEDANCLSSVSFGMGDYLTEFAEVDSRSLDLESAVEVAADVEGARIAYYTTKYERSSRNRAAAIAIHGARCQACGFDFEKTYGALGRGFIEVHHAKPLFSLEEEVAIDPVEDLVCLCSNCHRMVHRAKGSVLSLEELREILKAKAADQDF